MDDNVREHLRAALETADHGEKQFHIRQALQYCDRTPSAVAVHEE